MILATGCHLIDGCRTLVNHHIPVMHIEVGVRLHIRMMVGRLDPSNLHHLQTSPDMEKNSSVG